MKRLAALVLLGVVLIYGAPLLRGQEPSKPPETTSPIANVPGTLTTPAPGSPSQTAVVTTTVPSPASPQHVPEQVMWALAMSYALSYLTKKGWLSFLTPESSARVKAFCGFLVAAGTAAGIHFAVSGTLLDGQGVSFTITGLSVDAFKDIGFQWVSQQAWYSAVVKKG